MRRLSVLVIALVTVLSISSNAFASGFNLSIPPVLQEKTNWCWAATGTRILWWFGYDYSQCAVHAAAQGNCFDTQDTLGGVSRAMTVLVGMSGTYVSYPLSWDSYVYWMNMYQPVGVRFLYDNGNGHIITANGYWQDDNNSSNKYVDYIDSADATQNEVTWTWFLGGSGSGATHTWTHSLYNFN